MTRNRIVTYHVSVWFWPWWHIQGVRENYGRVLHPRHGQSTEQGHIRLTYEEVLRRKLMQYDIVIKVKPKQLVQLFEVAQVGDHRQA